MIRRNASGSVIQIGKQGENLALEIAFTDAATWGMYYGGEGTFVLMHQRPGEEAVYPCDLYMDNCIPVWRVSSADTAIASSHNKVGRAELRYLVGDTVVKSCIYRTMIAQSLTGTDSEPPDPAGKAWYDKIESAIGDLSKLDTNAKENLVAAINEAARSGDSSGCGGIDMRVFDGYIQYSKDGLMWTNLILVSELKGDTGAKGEKGDTGAKGEPGQKGDTGAKGADGLTPTIGANGNWYIGSTDTQKPSRGEKGEQGLKGDTGATDLSLGISGAQIGQIAKITAVDTDGKPTAWEPVDMASGGEREWVEIGEVTTTEDTTEKMIMKFTQDVHGNPLSLKGVLIIGKPIFSDTNKHQCLLVCNDNKYGGNANYLLYEQILRNNQTFTVYSEFLRADGLNSVAVTAFNSGNVKQNGGCGTSANTWSPGNDISLQFPMRGVTFTILDTGLLAGSNFKFWGVNA